MKFPKRCSVNRLFYLFAVCLLAATSHAQISTLVTSTGDSGPGTLRQAIMDVNNSNGGAINFKIDPNIFGPGPWTILPMSRLDKILHRTSINGYSQAGSINSSGAGLDTIMIEIDGSNAPDEPLLSFYVTATGSRVAGLSLFGSKSAQLLGISNKITIHSNYIGIRADGETVVPMHIGMVVAMSFSSQVRDNLIGPAENFGMFVSGTGHTVDGNWFGLSQFGAPLRAGRTERALCAGCTVGIDPANDPNLAPAIQRIQQGIRNSVFSKNRIVDTNYEAIRLSGVADENGVIPSGMLASFGNTFSKNTVGLDVWGQAAQDNIRVAMRIEGTHNNRIVDNTMTRADYGILLGSGQRGTVAGNANTIRGNSIWAAEMPIGIDPINGKPVSNDALDIDTGANNFQNKPTLKFANSNGRIRGVFDGAANQKFIIEFYTSKTCTPEGFGSGGYRMDQTSVTTDGNGRAAFDLIVGGLPLGGLSSNNVIGATATAVEIDANGAEVETDTSEFSECQTVSMQLATTTELAALPKYVLARDQSVRLSAKVSNANSTPVNGTVEFSAVSESGERILGRAQLQSNQAILSTPGGVLANSGKYQIVARYLGDDDHTQSEGAGETVVFRPPSALLSEAQTSLVRYRLSGMTYETELNGNWAASNLGNGNRVLDIAPYLNARLDRFLTVDSNNRFNLFDNAGMLLPVASLAFDHTDQIEDFSSFDLDYRMDALVFSRASNKWQITLCAFDIDSCERTTPLNVSAEYRNALTGDFNGDGQMDILWSDGSGRGKAISLMQGTSMLSQQTINGPMNYRSVASGDFDGDGYEDIVWHNAAASDVLIWFMKGGVMSEMASVNVRGDLESRGPAYFALVGAANYGHASLIWRDRSTGEVFAWDDIRPSSGALTFIQRIVFMDPNMDLVPTR
jgi:parallel beta-helix repeat protein